MKTRKLLAVAWVFAIAIPLSAQIVVDPNVGYLEDFETGGVGWSTAGTLWELGTPAQAGISAAFSGVNCFMTDLDANYPNSSAESVEATFDFSAFPYDPTFSFQLRANSEDGWDGVQVRIDTGSGFTVVGSASDPNWYNDDSVFGLSSGPGFTGDNGAYTLHSHVLPGAAGVANVVVQFFFGSDSSVNDEGVAFDDVMIELGPIPAIVLDPMTPYLEDFESGPGGYFAQDGLSGSSWEFGTPSAANINAAASGTSAWAIDLDAPYLDSTTAILNTRFDATAFTADPVFSMNIFHDSESGWDGTFIEIDTGSGFTPLGAVGEGSNWYTDTSSATGLDHWSGNSAGYVNAAILLPGTAGTIFALRLVFISDSIFVTGDGVAIDDISIFNPPSPYPGTGEDLLLTSSVNFGPLTGGNGLSDVKSVLPGDLATLFLESPGGTFDLQPYALVGTLFDGMVGPVPMLDVGAYAAANSVVVLGLGAGDYALGFGAILPPSGVGVTFAVPPAFAGLDLLFQGFSITNSGAVSMFYASSDGHVLDG